MRLLVAVVILAGCGNTGAVSPDAAPDARAPGTMCAVTDWPTAISNRCASTAPATKPPECARPSGVNWLDVNFDHPLTAAMPAGYFSESTTGCLWVIVEPSASGIHVSAGSYGCGFHTVLPDIFTEVSCGLYEAVDPPCTTMIVGVEGCWTELRDTNASGGIRITYDLAAGTVTMFGGYDTSSSNVSFTCEQFCP